MKIRSLIFLVLLCGCSFAYSEDENIELTAPDIKMSECLAYWQLRSVALLEEHSIDSVKLSELYDTKYQTALAVLKSRYPPRQLVTGIFAAMQKMLSKIDDDYSRANELASDYEKHCPIAV